MTIYVEILIRAEMDKLWSYTQTPDIHQKWDLRFSKIEYLPRPDESQPQQFLYTTRMGFGLSITGKGESVGSREESTGCRTSALQFWSDDPCSLIRTGSGYWQYAPSADGIRFLTQYNYETRFRLVGRWFDRLIFRPMLGWATAWSFDRLRLWLERGIDPAVSLDRAAIYVVARLSLAVIWIYQGLLPKLLFHDQTELASLKQLHLFSGVEAPALSIIGVAEILFGLLLLIRWHSRRLLTLNIVLLIVLTAGAFIAQPHIITAAFNPFTLNLATIVLSVIGLVSARDLPSARRCCRTPPVKLS